MINRGRWYYGGIDIGNIIDDNIWIYLLIDNEKKKYIYIVRVRFGFVDVLFFINETLKIFDFLVNSWVLIIVFGFEF